MATRGSSKTDQGGHAAGDHLRSVNTAARGRAPPKPGPNLGAGEVVADLLYAAGDLRCAGVGTATTNLAAELEALAGRLEGGSSPAGLPRAPQRLEQVAKRRRR